VLELHKLLPRSNCQACGQPAYVTFALQLAIGHERLATCPSLLTDGHRVNREQLQAVLDAAGLSGGLCPSG
jgi:ArsR family metal-binding transcriptional regulator